MKVELTREECIAIHDFIELNLFENIRNDNEIDNMNWLILMVGIYEKTKVENENEPY